MRARGAIDTRLAVAGLEATIASRRALHWSVAVLVVTHGTPASLWSENGPACTALVVRTGLQAVQPRCLERGGGNNSDVASWNETHRETFPTLPDSGRTTPPQPRRRPTRAVLNTHHYRTTITGVIARNALGFWVIVLLFAIVVSVQHAPLDLTLELAPKARFDVVDLRSRFPDEHEALASYPQCLYWSFHTTAGFLDHSLATRLNREQIPAYVDAFRALFPEGADYEHDRMDRRTELSASQRAVEPRNGDSHLAFIAGGLRSCVTYPNRNNEAVCFVDLDGTNRGKPRRRRARVIGFRRERVIDRARVEVPVSPHEVDSVNLKDARLGLDAVLNELVARTGVAQGRLLLELDPAERHSALTVNEYETLLMKHDLAEVLRNPLRFMARQTRHAMANPRAVPAKTLGYAKYDLVRVFNTGLDTLGLRDSVIERLLARTLAAPAARFFRMRRSVSLLVSKRTDGTHGIVEGTYQSPILVQWQRSARKTRVLHVALTELD